MLITPTTEQALIDLAHRGLWLKVVDSRLQVVAVLQGARGVTDDLREVLVANRTELLRVIPGMEEASLALTGPVVRVLFARLNNDQRLISFDSSEFSTRYDDLAIAERVSHLWWTMDGPLEERDAMRREVA